MQCSSQGLFIQVIRIVEQLMSLQSYIMVVLLMQTWKSSSIKNQNQEMSTSGTLYQYLTMSMLL